MILEAIINAEMNNQWPDEPFATGKHASRRWSRYSAAKVTDGWRRVRAESVRDEVI